MTVLYDTGLGGFGPILLPLQSSNEAADVPTNANAITSGTNLSGLGGNMVLWIFGLFATNSFSINWLDTGTGTSTDLTPFIMGVTSTLIEVFVPDSLFATLVNTTDTVTVTVTDNSLHLSAGPVLHQPGAGRPATLLPGGHVGRPLFAERLHRRNGAD